MKGLLCRQPGHYGELCVEEIALPQPGPGEVRIEVHFATVGFGHILIVAGKYQRKPPLPFVPGTEAAGVVTAVGPGVQGLRPGDRVAAALDWGAHAQEAIAQANRCWRVPDGVDLATAATLPVGYGTSWAALHWRARIQRGETLVVYGAAGGIGLTAVQLGKLAGAKVIAVAGSEDRVEIARRHGADLGVVHGGTDLARRIKALNGGRGVDVVFDPVGGELFDQALRCVRPEGRIVLVGFASGTVPQIPANIMLVKNIDVLGFNFGHSLWGWGDDRPDCDARLDSMMASLFDAVLTGRLSPPESMQFPLGDFVQAFDAVAQRRSTGRVLLRIGG